MRKRSKLRHQAQTRANDVCVEQAAVFNATLGGQNTVAKLSGAVSTVQRLDADLERYRDDRVAAASDCKAGRVTVLGGLTALVNIAPFVTLDPSAAKVLHLPLTTGDDNLLAVAREALEKVTPNAQAFIDQGLPANVLTDLPKQIAALAAARLALAKARRDYTMTTDAIRAALAEGDDAIRIAHTILRNTPSAPKAAIEQLRIAKRIGPSTVDQSPAAAPGPGTPTAPVTTPKVA
jgi:hypothetical protein